MDISRAADHPILLIGIGLGLLVIAVVLSER